MDHMDQAPIDKGLRISVVRTAYGPGMVLMGPPWLYPGIPRRDTEIQKDTLSKYRYTNY